MGKEEKGGGKGEREGRKRTEEGPTKNSCRGGPECEVTPLILSKTNKHIFNIFHHRVAKPL